MVKAETSALVRSSPEQLFNFIAVDFFDNYPRWSPEVIELETLSDGPIRRGTQGRQVRVDHGHRTESTFHVIAFEPAERIEFEGLTAPYFIRYRLEPLNETTRLHFTFELRRLEFFMRPFERLIRHAVTEGAGRIVSNIKQLVEHRDTARP